MRDGGRGSSSQADEELQAVAADQSIPYVMNRPDATVSQSAAHQQHQHGRSRVDRLNLPEDQPPQRSVRLC